MEPDSLTDERCRSVSEHVFADSRIIIREDEPTSIIGFTLASRPYQDKLRNLAYQQRTAKKQEGAVDVASNGETLEKLEPQIDDAVDPDESGRKERGTHLNYGQSVMFRAILRSDVIVLRLRKQQRFNFLPDILCRAIRQPKSCV